MKYFGLSHLGKVRQANEDSLGDEITPNGHVFVVCDGMGGHVGGAKASQLAVASILEFFRNNEYDKPQDLIRDAIHFANTQVHGHASSFPEFKGMGTTVVILLHAKDGKIYYGHVGDSRIYLFEKGELKKLTKDHSYVQFLVDTGEITEEEMETHPRKNQILKALGIEEEVKADVAANPIELNGGELFLLCSDGLNSMISDEKIKGHLVDFNPANLENTAKVLIEDALENGGKDNVTVSLITFNKSVGGEKDDTLDFSRNTRVNRSNNNLYLIIGFALVAITVLAFYFFQNSKSSVNNETVVEQDTLGTNTKVAPDSINTGTDSLATENNSSTEKESKAIEAKEEKKKNVKSESKNSTEIREGKTSEEE